MELKRVRIDQIVPDVNNPRKEFSGIDELARSLMANAADPGQPVNAIVVVQDGDLYRIFDGERRYRAMCLNGTEEANVVVFGDYDEAQSAFGMLASDNKERLTEQERSQAVQHALQLGMKPATVDDIAGLKKGVAGKVKKARRALGEAAAQATIDQLLEASSLKERGASDEEVEKILSAEPEDWQTLADAARNHVIRREFRDAASALVSKHGFELVDERPDGAVYKGMYTKLEKLEEYLGGNVPEGAVFRFFDSHSPSIDVYAPRTGSVAEEDPFAKQKDELREMLASARDARIRWYAESLMPAPGKAVRSRETPHVDALIIEIWLDLSEPERFLSAMGWDDVPERLSRASSLSGGVAMSIYEEAEREPSAYYAADLLQKDLAGEEISPIDRDSSLGQYAEWAAAFMADGCGMDPAEKRFYELVCANLEPATDADDGISGDGADEAPADGIDEAPPVAEDALEAAIQDVPAEPVATADDDSPLDDDPYIEYLLDATASELRIADEAAPAGETIASADASELDVASLSFDGRAVV